MQQMKTKTLRASIFSNPPTAPVHRDVVARRRPLPQLVLLEGIGAVAEGEAEGCSCEAYEDKAGMAGTVWIVLLSFC